MIVMSDFCMSYRVTIQIIVCANRALNKRVYIVCMTKNEGE